MSVLTYEDLIRERQVLTEPLFIEPMQMETVRANGSGGWISGLSATSGVFPPGGHRLLERGENRGYRTTDHLE